MRKKKNQKNLRYVNGLPTDAAQNTRSANFKHGMSPPPPRVPIPPTPQRRISNPIISLETYTVGRTGTEKPSGFECSHGFREDRKRVDRSAAQTDARPKWRATGRPAAGARRPSPSSSSVLNGAIFPIMRARRAYTDATWWTSWIRRWTRRADASAKRTGTFRARGNGNPGERSQRSVAPAFATASTNQNSRTIDSVRVMRACAALSCACAQLRVYCIRHTTYI